MNSKFVAFILFLLPLAGNADPLEKWEISPKQSMVLFQIKHMGVSTVKGTLGPITGTFIIDTKKFTKSEIEASIDVRKISTGHAARDNHLKTEDFLSIKKYPAIKFSSTRVQSLGRGKTKVTGKLEFLGKSQKVDFQIITPIKRLKIPKGKPRLSLVALVSIDRRKWGIDWNKKTKEGKLIAGFKVDVTLVLHLIQK